MIKTFYLVTTRFYDDGKVSVRMSAHYDEYKPENEYIETSTCDIYRDFFETYLEALNWYNDALKA